ncbi:response regulator [Vibrio sagamiensis]|uniref:Response regulator n=1 Tax=Vibrio sagamiensis NBRC 104589 TaxID=1219064 RepID=A0A511QDK0_9VIBR|nr:response regulator [Vibrio sagamiensis]PNQ62414.1 response regulator [Vibrio agarivorans]GEM74502.1 response regulator [Vibrio sagamiensis NBRC 104589]
MDKLNLICVDDQREVLRAVLQDLQCFDSWVNIEDCESADEAIELMDELDSDGQMIALVISDHVMPGKTGVELLASIANDTRYIHTRKVLLTGQATHNDTINAINLAGIDHYFEKPWQSELLIKCVRKLLTNFIFDVGLDYTDFQGNLDQNIILERLK